MQIHRKKYYNLSPLHDCLFVVGVGLNCCNLREASADSDEFFDKQGLIGYRFGEAQSASLGTKWCLYH